MHVKKTCFQIVIQPRQRKFSCSKKAETNTKCKAIYLTGYSYHAKHIKMCKNKKVSKQIKVDFKFKT